MKTIEVVAAIIRKGDKIFATQRGYGEWKDWWELPGGKIEEGESPREALVREIREELSAEIGVDKFLCTIEWDYPKFHLTMHCFMCSLLSGGLHLNEHEAARWLSADTLRSVRWLPADDQLLPLIEKELKKEITVDQIIAIVQEASARMVRSGFEVHDKGTRENLVTSSDLAVQDFLTERLRDLLPGSGFLCEEEDLRDIAGHEYVWIIDPIDGTANYSRGNENCCISVALIRGGEPYMGVVYSPWRGECWWAEKGRGAFCDGKTLQVSRRPYEEGLLFTALSTYHKEWARCCSDIIYDIYMDCNDVRRTGSAAVELCLMAEGFAELYFEMRLMPWDYAAASLILTEAGGTVCGFDGAFPSLYQPSLLVAANTKENAARLLAAVKKHLDQIPY
jgi:mutator protein MutT